jgi:hypothetical protein
MIAQRGSGGLVKAQLLVLFVVVIVGCKAGEDQSTGTVKGTVKYKGVAVHGGKILFYGPNGRTASAVISEGGQYQASDVPVGEVHVAVSTSLPPIVQTQAAPKPKRRFNRPDANPMPEAVQTTPIPIKYTDPAQSGLSLTVTEGEQPYDIDLP